MKMGIKEIARRAGVSTMTVSRVINNHKHVKEATRRRVQEIIEQLGYVPNIHARNFARSRYQKGPTGVLTYIVKVVTPQNYGNRPDFVSFILQGTEFEFSKARYQVVYTVAPQEKIKDSEWIYENIDRWNHCDGIVFVSTANRAMIELCSRQSLPLVIVDDYIREGNIDCVVTDNENGFLKLMNYLLEIGHRRIAYVGSIRGHTSWEDRFAGYKRALELKKIKIEDDRIIECAVDSNSAFQKVSSWIKKRKNRVPTAFVGCNDIVAIGVIKAFLKAGYKIPQDVSVAGFDDIPLSSSTHPALTSMRVFKEDMGSVAAQLLLSKVKEPQQKHRKIVLPPELIIRESTAKSGENDIG